MFAFGRVVMRINLMSSVNENASKSKKRLKKIGLREFTNVEKMKEGQAGEKQLTGRDDLIKWKMIHL